MMLIGDIIYSCNFQMRKEIERMDEERKKTNRLGKDKEIELSKILTWHGVSLVILTVVSLIVLYAVIGNIIERHYQDTSKSMFETITGSLVYVFDDFIEHEDMQIKQQLDDTTIQIATDPANTEKYLQEFLNQIDRKEAAPSIELVDSSAIPQEISTKLTDKYDYIIQERMKTGGVLTKVFFKADDKYYLIQYEKNLIDNDEVVTNINKFTTIAGIKKFVMYNTKMERVYFYGESFEDAADETYNAKITDILNSVMESNEPYTNRDISTFTFADKLQLNVEDVLMEPLLVYAEFDMTTFLTPIIGGLVAAIIATLIILLIAGVLARTSATKIATPFIQLIESMKDFSNTKVFDESKLPTCRVKETNELIRQYANLAEEITATMQELRATNEELESAYEDLEKVSKEIENSYIDFAQQLAVIAESYDEVTGDHIGRVSELSAFLASELGLPSNVIENIQVFSPLHDIGKILVPKDILTKPGRLTDEEFEEMKRHTLYGAKIIGDKEYFKLARNIALYHHEKADGSGYPFGLKNEEIPVEAKIVALVDVYDALRSERPYKKAFTHEQTMKIILEGDGRTDPNHFDPQLLKIFKEKGDEINKLWEAINARADKQE